MFPKDTYELWLEKAVDDPDVIADLQNIRDNDEEIAERFSSDLQFGTAGLRGIISAGTSRMNVHTVRRATQGFADYLCEKFAEPSVTIGYDSRIKSDTFASTAAEVLAANGVKVNLFPELVPTPVVSFGVREFKASGGIMITASHNPASDNGYKVYGADGCQLTDEAASAIEKKISVLDIFEDVKTMSFEDAVAAGKINIIEDSFMQKYLDKVQEQQINPEVTQNTDLSVVYSPLNGTGNKPVRQILDRIGIKNVHVVAEQELPDGNFTTVPKPNPEYRETFNLAIKLAESVSSDLLLATDPDADRVGIAVKDGDGYRLFSGNEVGAMLLNYILRQRRAKGTMPDRPLTIKTIVTTPLVNAIATKYGVEVVNVLTGFKYIGEQIALLEEKDEENRYIFGFEESYGYLSGTYVRDKDAVVAAMLICEMAAYYKAQGRTLIDVINGIYAEFGYFLTSVRSYRFEGLQGLIKREETMQDLRQNCPVQIGGIKVWSYADYQKSVQVDLRNGKTKEIKLPPSNVLAYNFEEGATAIIRPSGTEPMIKVYVTARGVNKADAEIVSNSLLTAIAKLLGV